jgi:hypothetical protein
MLEHIQRTLEGLKLKIKHNVDQIILNQGTIQNMMKQSMAAELLGQYELYNNQNKTLLAQNNDLINVQLTLINFIEKYKNTAILNDKLPLIDIYSITDIQEVFTLTIKGILPYDQKHPYYCDSEFIDKLIIFYKGTEDYERCQELIKLKENSIS